MMVGAPPKEHCGQFLAFWASFLSGRDADNYKGKGVGNTAQCRVCERWFAYVWLNPDQYILEEADSREAVQSQAAAA